MHLCSEMAIECTPNGLKLIAVDNGKTHLLLAGFNTDFPKLRRGLVPASKEDFSIVPAKKAHVIYDDGIFGI